MNRGCESRASRDVNGDVKGGELSERFPICTSVRQGSVEGLLLFILFLAAVMAVAFPANARYRSQMDVEVEVQEGDITNARRFWKPASHRVLDTMYTDDTALVANSQPACRRLYSSLRKWLNALDS